MLLPSKLLGVFIFLLHDLSDAQLTDLQCDFSDVSSSGRFCNWNPDSVNHFTFISGQEREVSSVADGPLGSSDSNGTFLQLQAKNSYLVSPEVQAPEFCLSFYYYLFGAATGEISVSRTTRLGVSSVDSETLFYRNQDHEAVDKWHLFQGTIYGHDELNFKYTVSTKREDGTELAIDKIDAVSGACQASRYYCDFDLAIGDSYDCGWATFSTSADHISWAASLARDNHYQIEKDHSTRSAHGSFVTAESFETAAIGTTWSIAFPITDSTSKKHCLSFWIYSNSPVELVLYQREIGLDAEPVDIVAWRSNKAGPASWVKKSFTFSKTDYSPLYDVLLVMKKTSQTDKPAAFDSIMYSEGECPKPATCDFNEDFCAFETSGSKWLIGQGRLAKPTNLGSHFVRPASESPYVYTDFSLSPEKSTAILSSDYVSPGDYCLSWKDFHSKSDFHSFEVYAADSEGNKLLNVYELKPTTTLGAWSSNTKSLLARGLKQDFRVVFEVQSVSGFTALDLVDLSSGACQTEPTHDEHSIDKYGSCDFQNGMCAWENVPDSKTGLEWRINQIPGYKKRSFAYLSPTNEEGEESILKMTYSKSKGAVSANGEYCLSLNSIVEGHGNQKLTLKIKASDINEEITLSQSTDWKLSQTEFEITDATDSIEFSIVGFVDKDSMVAVDSINIYEGDCHRSDDQASKLFYKCEFQDDDRCEINVDSVYQDNIPSFARRTMETRSLHHDKVFAAEISNPSKAGKTRFYMPTLEPKMRTCARFWYLTRIAENITFRVFLEKGLESEDGAPTSVVLFETSENLETLWNPAMVTITDKGKWRLGFEVDVASANTFENLISVDSISVRGGSCPSYYSCTSADELCFWHSLSAVTANYRIQAHNAWDRQQSQLVTYGSRFPKKAPEGKDGSYYVTSGYRNDALLVSPRFSWPASEDVKYACFTFYDHYENTDGGGTIFMTSDLRATADVIKNMHGDGSPSGQWVKKNVQLERKENSFWLIFYAHTTKVWGSFNALGDLSLEFNKCPLL